MDIVLLGWVNACKTRLRCKTFSQLRPNTTQTSRSAMASTLLVILAIQSQSKAGTLVLKLVMVEVLLLVLLRWWYQWATSCWWKQGYLMNDMASKQDPCLQRTKSCDDVHEQVALAMSWWLALILRHCTFLAFATSFKVVFVASATSFSAVFLCKTLIWLDQELLQWVSMYNQSN